MKQLTETINYVRDNCRTLSRLGFTKFPTKYARTFTEPESGYVVDCTVGLSKTRRDYSLGSLSMEWPKNPLVLDYIPITSLLEILELVNKLYGIGHIEFSETDGNIKKITLDECKKINSQPEKISHLYFSSKKIVQLPRKIHVGPGYKRKPFKKEKLSFSYEGAKTKTSKVVEDLRQKHGMITDLNEENKTPSWDVNLTITNLKEQDLELITQIFDITVKSSNIK